MQYAILGKDVKMKDAHAWVSERKNKHAVLYIFDEDGDLLKTYEIIVTKAVSESSVFRVSESEDTLMVNYVTAGDYITGRVRVNVYDRIYLGEHFMCADFSGSILYGKRPSSWAIVLSDRLLDLAFLRSVETVIGFRNAMLISCIRAVERKSNEAY